MHYLKLDKPERKSKARQIFQAIDLFVHRIFGAGGGSSCVAATLFLFLKHIEALLLLIIRLVSC